MTAPDSEPGGPVPQTPWDFPLWGREQKGRRTNDRPPTLKASALFTIRRSGCVPAEPYPPNRTNRVAPGARLCYAFHNFRHANGGVRTQNKNRFYILAKPFCCPAHGERLSYPIVCSRRSRAVGLPITSSSLKPLRLCAFAGKTLRCKKNHLIVCPCSTSGVLATYFFKRIHVAILTFRASAD